MFRLGYVLYLEGKYDAAVATLNKITSPPASDEIKVAGDALIPQAMAAQAGKMRPGDPNRKAAFENAIAQFRRIYREDTRIARGGVGELWESGGGVSGTVIMMRRRRACRKPGKIPNSESVSDSEDLLAVVLTAQANDILKNHGETARAFGKFDEALGYLANIIQQHKDVALANDAQFQAGEVLYNRANAQEGEKRIKDLTNAISVYREVLPKEMMLQAQQSAGRRIVQRIQQAVLDQEPGEVPALQQQQDRENAKLEALKNAPDQSLNALLRIASCYFLLQQI